MHTSGPSKIDCSTTRDVVTQSGPIMCRHHAKECACKHRLLSIFSQMVQSTCMTLTIDRLPVYTRVKYSQENDSWLIATWTECVELCCVTGTATCTVYWAHDSETVSHML